METKDKMIYLTMGIASVAIAAFIFGYNRFKSSVTIKEGIDTSGIH